MTVSNLNDNIDEKFLSDMVQRCGAFEELVIYTHPVTKKHLHLARIVFMDVASARQFIDKYNDKSVMGKVCSMIYASFLRITGHAIYGNYF